MTTPNLCRYCDVLFTAPTGRLDHRCAELDWRRRACAALGHRAPQDWVSGKTGCGYCGQEIPASTG